MPRVDQPIPFIGPSYVSRSLNVDAQRSINLFPELVESKDGKNDWYLLGTPGLKAFVSLPQTPIRCMYQCLGRCFAVAGNGLYEIFEDGTNVLQGTLLTAAGYVGVSDNSLQVTFVDGPNQYNFTLRNNFFKVNPNGANFQGANTTTFLDGYTVFPKPNSAEFFITDQFAAGSLNDLDFATKEGASDFISTIVNLHRQLVILGTQTSEIWYDQGTDANNVQFPLAPIEGIFIECGCAAPFTAQKIDTTLMWLGRDARGQGIVYALNGAVPMRVSTHPIENIIQEMGDLSEFIAYTYQEEGHSFYVLNNPNASTTLVYDATSKLWHERQFVNARTGLATRHRANFYAFAFSKHLMGDWENGTVYESNLDFLDDAGAAIHRTRTAPHISDALRRTFYDFFQVDVEAGVGLDGSGQGIAPQMMMRYSDDGAHTWSPERWVSIGAIGKFKSRAYWNRLGQGRDRVFQIKITDPVKVVLIDAKVGATNGRF